MVDVLQEGGTLLKKRCLKGRKFRNLRRGVETPAAPAQSPLPCLLCSLGTMYVEKCTRPFQELVALSGKNDYFDQLVFYVNVFLKVTARLHMSYVQVQTRVI